MIFLKQKMIGVSKGQPNAYSQRAGSPLHKAPANIGSRERVEPYWIYCIQFYFALQETVSVI